jgi:hypothetical protein
MTVLLAMYGLPTFAEAATASASNCYLFWQNEAKFGNAFNEIGPSAENPMGAG